MAAWQSTVQVFFDLSMIVCRSAQQLYSTAVVTRTYALETQNCGELQEFNSNRSPLEPTQRQPLPGATPSRELHPATAPPAVTSHSPAHENVVRLTPEAQRAKDQEAVYSAWQRAHKEAEEEKRRRTRRHQEIAAQVWYFLQFLNSQRETLLQCLTILLVARKESNRFWQRYGFLGDILFL